MSSIAINISYNGILSEPVIDKQSFDTLKHLLDLVSFSKKENLISLSLHRYLKFNRLDKSISIDLFFSYHRREQIELIKNHVISKLEGVVFEIRNFDYILRNVVYSEYGELRVVLELV